MQTATITTPQSAGTDHSTTTRLMLLNRSLAVPTSFQHTIVKVWRSLVIVVRGWLTIVYRPPDPPKTDVKINWFGGLQRLQ